MGPRSRVGFSLWFIQPCPVTFPLEVPTGTSRKPPRTKFYRHQPIPSLTTSSPPFPSRQNSSRGTPHSRMQRSWTGAQVGQRWGERTANHRPKTNRPRKPTKAHNDLDTARQSAPRQQPRTRKKRQQATALHETRAHHGARLLAAALTGAHGFPTGCFNPTQHSKCTGPLRR